MFDALCRVRRCLTHLFRAYQALCTGDRVPSGSFRGLFSISCASKGWPAGYSQGRSAVGPAGERLVSERISLAPRTSFRFFGLPCRSALVKCDARFRHAGIILTLFAWVSLQARIYGGPKGRIQQRFAPPVPGLSYPMSLAIGHTEELGRHSLASRTVARRPTFLQGRGNRPPKVFHSWAFEQGCRVGRHEDQRGVGGGCPKGCLRDYS